MSKVIQANPDGRVMVKLEEDPETGDLILPLNEDILKQMGWDIGDTLVWEEIDSETWAIKKQDDTEE
jgi:hypothetical protein